MTVLLAWLLVTAPITRDGARDDARRELRKAIYRPQQASWPVRVLQWIFTRLQKALDTASSVVPGGLPGLLLLVVVVIGLVILLRMRLGPLRRSDLLTDQRGTPPQSAADYRAEAAAFAAAGDWREALRARFRALIRELEQRGVLDQRAGRTAGEISNEASAAMPAIATSMRHAAEVFNEVWYGDRPATQAAYDSMAQVDESVRSGRNITTMAAR